MSQVVKHYCDWPECESERAGNRSVLAFSHSQMCASGNGSERWDAVFDLCVTHLLVYLDALTESLQSGKKVQRSPFQIVKDLEIHHEIR